jgi:methylated-DNA-[protein]-cysteine S-methyltransferase
MLSLRVIFARRNAAKCYNINEVMKMIYKKICAFEIPGLKSRKLKITLVEEDGALTGLCFPNDKRAEVGEVKDTPLLKRAEKQLAEYFSGKRQAFDLALDLRGTDFQIAVWNELAKIPYGETRTYGEIAKAVGNTLASRAVGMANNRNPIAIIIPCHRVIGASGDLVGYGGGLPIKAALLELENRKSAK